MTLLHARIHCYKMGLHKSSMKGGGAGEYIEKGEWSHIFGDIPFFGRGKPHTISEIRFVVGINVKPRSLERIALKRNEKCIKLCLIYGIYMLLTSKYKVLFPWSSLSLMYYLSVNVVHSELNSYGNISVPTAALLHP